MCQHRTQSQHGCNEFPFLLWVQLEVARHYMGGLLEEAKYVGHFWNTIPYDTTPPLRGTLLDETIALQNYTQRLFVLPWTV